MAGVLSLQLIKSMFDFEIGHYIFLIFTPKMFVLVHSTNFGLASHETHIIFFREATAKENF